MVNKIPGSAEHWESGKLGLNNATAKVVTQADARWPRHLPVDHLDQHHDLRRSRRAGYPLKKGLKVPGRAW
jgi:hypothetical protein